VTAVLGVGPDSNKNTVGVIQKKSGNLFTLNYQYSHITDGGRFDKNCSGKVQ
jgi:hypothetical protein